MFVGHYAAALAAKAATPRAPLWVYVGGCQLLDVAWAALLLVGAEKVRIDPSLPGNPFDLFWMPYTHSLPGALAISVAAGLAALGLRLGRGVAAMTGAVVFSHWLLDALVHRPDLSLAFGGPPKVGFALWNAPGIELVVEMGLLALAALAWTGVRVRRGGAIWPAAAFTAWLAALQAIDEAGGPKSVPAMAVTALVVYAATTALAWVVERRGPRTSILAG